MKDPASALVTQILFALLGALIFGFGGLLGMMIYGGNFGCWAWIDTLFNLQGYESCGAFGWWIGIFLGMLGGWMLAFLLQQKSLRSTREPLLFLSLWALTLLLIFSGIYFKNVQEAQEHQVALESKLEEKRLESEVFDPHLPLEISGLTQSAETLEVLFTQGNYELTVRLITGAVAEKWAREIEKQAPKPENANIISHFYSSEWSPHVGQITNFDYETSSELSSFEVLQKNLFLGIEGLKLLAAHPRLEEAFKPQVQELRNELMFNVKEEVWKVATPQEIEGLLPNPLLSP